MAAFAPYLYVEINIVHWGVQGAGWRRISSPCCSAEPFFFENYSCLFAVPGAVCGDCLAQYALLHLSGFRFGQRLLDAYEARHHEVGQLLDQEFGQRLEVDGGAGALRDQDQDLLFTVRALGRQRRRVLHRREFADGDLDFAGRDILALATDRILQPIEEKEVAVRILLQQVPRVEPAVAPGFRGRFGVVRITVAEHPRAARSHDQLAGLADRHFIVKFIDEARFDPVAHLAAALADKFIPVGADRRADLAHIEDRINIDIETLPEGGAGIFGNDRDPERVVLVRRQGRIFQEQPRQADHDIGNGRVGL